MLQLVTGLRVSGNGNPLTLTFGTNGGLHIAAASVSAWTMIVDNDCPRRYRGSDVRPSTLAIPLTFAVISERYISRGLHPLPGRVNPQHVSDFYAQCRCVVRRTTCSQLLYSVTSFSRTTLLLEEALLYFGHGPSSSRDHHLLRRPIPHPLYVMLCMSARTSLHYLQSSPETPGVTPVPLHP